MRPGERASPAPEDPLETLARAVRALLFRDPTEGERERFGTYLRVLSDWNRVHGLTGLKSPATIVRGLFCDSLLFLPLLPRQRPIDVADIGAGPGIPGMPLRILDHQIRLTLIESRRKPVSFLLALCRELRLDDVRVLHGRAEALVREDPRLARGFDAVVMRAVGGLPGLLDTGLGYLKRDGRLIASGPPEGVETPEIPGGWPAEWRSIEVPSLGVNRRFLVASRPTNGED